MLGWSSRKREEPDHPEQPFIVADVSVDPTNPGAVAVVYLPLHPVSYARPEGEQEDGVIEPTALFKPWMNNG
jgi:hypothetical protein